ncbi:wound-responsive family protein [Striga asiatica]|uniref:Wound-responsive family protein n=1 Tax=Striga asiatica TaxID=4170 RepID=A0A5A7Q1I5_STRAF|nr:wound-responsive family protein [Striga asiatica]
MAGGSKGGGPGPELGAASKPASSFESDGGRLRFTVELRSEETTIVSWKKLVREANLSNSGRPDPSVSEPEILPRPVSVPPLPPVGGAFVEPSAEKEQKDPQGQAGSTRLNTVIERIERMYAGNGSSDDEDVMLDNVPDDDEYDTDDSFIDDVELDDYFQVDNSAVKHHGFFVNRGKLERVDAAEIYEMCWFPAYYYNSIDFTFGKPSVHDKLSEPTISSNQQPKKRRHKDLAKGQNESDDGRNPNKTAKLVNKGKKASSVLQTISTNQPRIAGMPSIPGEDMQFQAAPVDAAEFSIKKKSSDSHATEDSLGFLDVGAIRQSVDIDEQMLENVSLKKHSTKLKDTEPHDAAAYRPNDKSSYSSKTHNGKQSSNVDDLDRPIQQKVKGGLVGKFDLNAPPNRDTVPTTKVTPMPRKQGSSVRPKATKLEKAIRELEKIVAESRPPSTEVQDPDNSSPAVKKRVPSEIRQKLLRVATLAQTSYGEIPVDVINRLMSIVGHLMQLRTLKVAVPVLSDGQCLYVFADVSRYVSCVVLGFSMHLPTLDTFFSIFSGSLSRNLRIMANMGLSAKQEKDGQIEKIKQEVAKMVEQRIPYMISKAEQLAANLDDFQEAGSEEKEVLKRKYSMDDVLGNKICDLYDLCVERIDEGSGPSIRRLYQELVVLWPSGLMDTDGIKRAIYRAKKKRRLCSPPKNREKLTNKKVLPPKPKDERSPLTKKPVFSARKPVALAHGPKVDKRKEEMAKASTNGNPVNAVASNSVPKKKMKKKPNPEALDAQVRLEKLALSITDERPKL